MLCTEVSHHMLEVEMLNCFYQNLRKKKSTVGPRSQIPSQPNLPGTSREGLGEAQGAEPWLPLKRPRQNTHHQLQHAPLFP